MSRASEYYKHIVSRDERLGKRSNWNLFMVDLIQSKKFNETEIKELVGIWKEHNDRPTAKKETKPKRGKKD